MLQVLVSIQGLILNAKPYFNEPGYANLGGTKHGEEKSLDYNERTFMYTLQTMVYAMRRPPKVKTKSLLISSCYLNLYLFFGVSNLHSGYCSILKHTSWATTASVHGISWCRAEPTAMELRWGVS